MITLDNVTYTYPATATPALRNLSLTIPAGQFCAVVGANGAGKSTLAYALAGFVPHFYHGKLDGKIMVGGKDTAATPLSELVLDVGLVFQNPFNQISGTKFTVREEIAFGLENLGVPRDEMLARAEAAMRVVGIELLADRSPLALSGGQMQRVA
ncbi:MAG: ABC transporter ATP-binding protein, partial [Chloroflexota bacterium]